jgi:diketogulonate reductase-like aldo/keto reductase
LNWVIHIHGETIVTIPGVTNARQAEESAEAQRFKLTEAEMTHLDELSRQIR